MLEFHLTWQIHMQNMGALEYGIDIHQFIKNLLDVVVVTTLIEMLPKCGCIDKTHDLFEKMPQTRRMQ